MDFGNALLVSGAGIAVVFFGLIMTALLIISLAKVVKMMSGEKEKPQAEVKAAENTVITPKVDPDVLAVITTVLEIERRLQFSNKTSKYTFKDRQVSSGLLR